MHQAIQGNKQNKQKHIQFKLFPWDRWTVTNSAVWGKFLYSDQIGLWPILVLTENFVLAYDSKQLFKLNWIHCTLWNVLVERIFFFITKGYYKLNNKVCATNKIAVQLSLVLYEIRGVTKKNPYPPKLWDIWTIKDQKGFFLTSFIVIIL